MKKNTQKFHSGFTLMEVMVSVSIFAIIITIGIGSLLTINSTLQKTRAERQAIDSVSFLLDTMTRQIRTGTEWSVTEDSISFTPQEDGGLAGKSNKTTYSLKEDRITYQEGNSLPVDITPAGISDISLFFTDKTGPNGQPYVTIELSAIIRSGQQDSQINVRTGVSQRAIESKTSVDKDLTIIPESPGRGEPFTPNGTE